MLRTLRALPAVVLLAAACSAAASLEPAPTSPAAEARPADTVPDSLPPDDPAPTDHAAPQRTMRSSATSPQETTPARLADLQARDQPPPARIRVPSLGIDAPVLGVGVGDDGELDVVDDTVNVGWYRYGPSPGERGSAVLAAHVDTARDGPGVFFELGSVEPGDRIDIELADGTEVGFFVESIEAHPKTQLPVGELFSRDGEPRIALITCGGAFDQAAGRYKDNVVVIARP